ncbi:MAG: hypothetical protein ACI9JM_000151 [Halioglobus sp.]|jgi:hypothetical protein
MKAIFFTLVLSVAASMVAPAAYAASGDSSSMRCGLSLGGISLVYSSDSKSDETEENQENAFNRVAGMIGSDASGVSHYMRAKSKDVERRLPPTFTFAQVGCSF